jgi:hypothetical protein
MRAVKREQPGSGKTPEPGGSQQAGSGKDLIEQLAEGGLERVGADIFRDGEGTHYWIHEVNLYRNGMFLFLVLKIFFFIWLALALFLIGLTASDDGLGVALSSMGRPMLWVLLFLLGLVTLSYYLYALLMGGRYSVLFQMDKKSVSHTQLPRQFKRTQTLGNLAAVAGLLAGNYTAAGAGMLSASHSTMVTHFRRLSAIKPKPRQHTIKLRSGLMHNQVYTAPEDFGFVLDFIREHAGKPMP